MRKAKFVGREINVKKAKISSTAVKSNRGHKSVRKLSKKTYSSRLEAWKKEWF